ncbi:DUF58 domain-containing protein [Agathobacter sp.]
MVNIILWIIAAAVTFYMSMIYGNVALALLGCFEIVFMLISVIYLFIRRIGIKAHLKVPVAMTEQGQKIRIKLSNSLYNTSGLKVKYLVKVTNNLTGEKSRKCFAKDGEYLYTAEFCGNYEFVLKKIKIYDFTGIFHVNKRMDESVNVEVIPEITEVPVRITDAVRNFFGDADIYDDFRPGYDPAELFDVREFRNGDRIQSIHWKLSAKTDDLMVKENSLPKACAVTVLADYKGGAAGSQADSFVKLVTGLSFSLMDLKCPHYVSWYDRSREDIVRARVDDEESFYIFLNHFLKWQIDREIDAVSLYREKYRAEKLVSLLTVDAKLQIRKDKEIVAQGDLGKTEIVI